jgi:hypothetical protein
LNFSSAFPLPVMVQTPIEKATVRQARDDDRPTEDDIAKAKLGPQGQPGKGRPDNGVPLLRSEIAGALNELAILVNVIFTSSRFRDQVLDQAMQLGSLSTISTLDHLVERSDKLNC